MVFAYIRVSTDKQTTENQRFELINLAQKRGFTIDSWTEETISGTKNVEDRKLHLVLKKLRRGDMLLVSELSRLGRNLMMIMGILHTCMERDVRVLTAKENYELGDNISSKVLAFAFGLSAEIERNLISQRTKEALARRKAEGVILGRPKGKKSKQKKLDNNDHLRSIRRLLEKDVSVCAIARLLGVNRATVGSTIKEHNLRDPKAKLPVFPEPVLEPIEAISTQYIDLCQPEVDPQPVGPYRKRGDKAPIEKIPLFRSTYRNRQ